MQCHKCRQAPPAEGDTWCLSCAGWEALGRELCSPWPAEGARKLAADLVVSCTRQVRGLRNYAQAVRSNQQAASRRREAEEPPRENERPSLKRRKPEQVDNELGAAAKRLPDAAKKEFSSSGEFEEESEEEAPDNTLAPLAGRDARRPPEPDGPPPSHRKEGDNRRDRHRGHQGHKAHRGGQQSANKGSKPRHRAGRKHQRLGRLEFDPTAKVHRKLSNHFLDTLSTDAGKECLDRLP